MSKSTFEKYEELMAQSVLFGGLPGARPGGTAYDPLDDESEDFLTSEDIVKMKEQDPDAFPGIQTPKGPTEIEEDVHFHRYSKRREHKYTEKEMTDITESCKTTLVHDYSEFDVYHMSDEERARNDSLQSLRTKLGGIRCLYRKVDQYIYAMRVVVEAWELLEKKENFIHTEEEFFRMVSEGRIYHSGINMPKLKGMNRYSLDMIVKYISDPNLDPNDLVPISTEIKDDFYSEDPDLYQCLVCGEMVEKTPWAGLDELKDHIREAHPEQAEGIDDMGNTEFLEKFFKSPEEMEMERLLSEEDVQFILDHADDPPPLKIKDIKPKMIKGYDRKTFGPRKKKGSKGKRYILQNLHDLLNKIQDNPANRDSSAPKTWLLTNSMFDPPKKERDVWDGLFFDGSWLSDDDLFLYDLAVREELLKQHPEGDRYNSYADKELQDFFRIMEENGMNVVELRRRMNMTEEGMKSAENKKVRKANRKLESALLQRIEKLNGDPKFKKLISKAEKQINEQASEY